MDDLTEVRLDPLGIPLNADDGCQDMCSEMLLKCQSVYRMEFLHLHDSIHLAEAFTRLAGNNMTVKQWVVVKLRKWNRREMGLPDHDGDFDSCLIFVPSPYALELSLNLKHLKFRPHRDIQELLTEFKLHFGHDKKFCDALVWQVEALGVERSNNRALIKQFFDKQEAEKFAISRRKADAEALKFASSYAEIQKIQIERKKREREEKEVEEESKKQQKIDKLDREQLEKDASNLLKTCRVPSCEKRWRGGKRWLNCELCDEFHICCAHKDIVVQLLAAHMNICQSKPSGNVVISD